MQNFISWNKIAPKLWNFNILRVYKGIDSESLFLKNCDLLNIYNYHPQNHQGIFWIYIISLFRKKIFKWRNLYSFWYLKKLCTGRMLICSFILKMNEENRQVVLERIRFQSWEIRQHERGGNRCWKLSMLNNSSTILMYKRTIPNYKFVYDLC